MLSGPRYGVVGRVFLLLLLLLLLLVRATWAFAGLLRHLGERFVIYFTDLTVQRRKERLESLWVDQRGGCMLVYLLVGNM